MQDVGRAMIAVNARAAQFNDLRSDSLVGRKIELAFAVITEVGRSGGASLQAISSNHLPGACVFNDQVIASAVKLVPILARVKRASQALIQFEIENFKTQTER